MKTATANHKIQLNHFEGTWHTTGQVLSGEDDGQHIEGLDTYEWLPGGHFLMHTADVLIGEKREHSVEIIGHDDETHTILGRSFGSDGSFDTMSFDLRQDEILISGANLRFNGRFLDDFKRISGIWESSTSHGWKALMEINLLKRS